MSGLIPRTPEVSRQRQDRWGCFLMKPTTIAGRAEPGRAARVSPVSGA